MGVLEYSGCVVRADVVGRVLGSSTSSEAVGTGVGKFVGESERGCILGQKVFRVGVGYSFATSVDTGVGIGDGR